MSEGEGWTTHQGEGAGEVTSSGAWGKAETTIRHTIDRFLASDRCANPNTRRSYGNVLDKLAGELYERQPVSDVTADELAEVFGLLWSDSASTTWNQRRAAVASWVEWCRDNGFPMPKLPGSLRRRSEGSAETRALSREEIERQLAREDVPLREKTLWHMLYETAARAFEILALDIEDLELENRHARMVTRDGTTEWVHWSAGTAKLLARLINGRTEGPVFLSERRPGPGRRPATEDLCPHTGRARLGYDRVRILLGHYTGWSLHKLRHSAAIRQGQERTAMRHLEAENEVDHGIVETLEPGRDSGTEADRSPSRGTLRDVARFAGVSPMTVSRVLNRSSLVAETTAERVRAAVAELGYRPNQSARNLRRGRNVTIVGLVVDNIANPYYANLSQAVGEAAEAAGALLVVSTHGGDPALERSLVLALLARGLDGLILSPATANLSYFDDDLLEGRPVVLLGPTQADVEADVVRGDYIDGVMQAVRHLRGYGHLRIGVIGHHRRSGDSRKVQWRRLEGYRRALAETGIAYDAGLVRWCSTVTDATAAVRELRELPDPPTALVTLNNRMTVGALRALGHGLDGVALVGFDDFDLADVFDPPVTVVTHDPADVGCQAARVLFERLDGRDDAPERLMLPMTLIARGSGELTLR